MIVSRGDKFFSLTMKDGGRKGVFVPDFGWEKTAPAHRYSAVRDYYLFHFVLSGRGEYSVDGKTYALAAGQGFLIEPQVETCYVSDSAEPWEYCWIGARGLDVVGFLESAELFNKHFFYYEPEFIGSLLALLSEFRVAESINPDYAGLKGNAAFLETMSCFVPQNSVSSSRSAAAVKSLAVDGAEYFNRHFAENIGVNEAAAALKVSRVYFSTVFSKEIGKSPKDYLAGVRIGQAKKMLAETLDTASTIAGKCGFGDKYVFSKSFKKAVGLSPDAYRKSIRQNSRS